MNFDISSYGLKRYDVVTVNSPDFDFTWRGTIVGGMNGLIHVIDGEYDIFDVEPIYLKVIEG